MSQVQKLCNSAAAAMCAVVAAWPAHALDAVVIGTSRQAGAEQGGYYAAIADGSYRKYGLEVTIHRLEPGTDPAPLLGTGGIDFSIDGNSFEQLELVDRGVPVVAIAAIFQKDPIAVLAHPGAGVKRFEDLRGRTVFMSEASRGTLWPWLDRRYRLSAGQTRPETGDLGRFLADPASIELGDVIDERFATAVRGGFEPVVLLPANDIYFTFVGLVQSSTRLVQYKPDLVQRFADATIEGWYRYLYDDDDRANALIEAANVAMTDVRLAHALETIKQYALIDSGHALAMGIGAIDGGRWGSFCKGTLGRPRDLCPDPNLLYTQQFVNQSHGLKLKETLMGE